MSGRVRVTRARARREREAVRDTSDEIRGGRSADFVILFFRARFDRILASTESKARCYPSESCCSNACVDVNRAASSSAASSARSRSVVSVLSSSA